MTPQINVNLKACGCGDDSLNAARRAGNQNPAEAPPHQWPCMGAPILIPCPIPRSVTFVVRVGECKCHEEHEPDSVGGHRTSTPGHFSNCPARPIRVTCSISGATWEESAVTGFMVGAPSQDLSPSAFKALADACRERWALVKALVLGSQPGERWCKMIALFEQRDAVFSALVKAHRAEDALIKACGDYEEAMRGEPVGIYRLRRESPGALERYVERVLEQVMAIGGI